MGFSHSWWLVLTQTKFDPISQDAAGRVGDVMSEQTARVQELRRQLVCAQTQESMENSTVHADTQALQEELRLALLREREAQQELSALRASLAGQQKQLQAQASLLQAQSQPDKVWSNHVSVSVCIFQNVCGYFVLLLPAYTEYLYIFPYVVTLIKQSVYLMNLVMFINICLNASLLFK